MPSPPQSVEKEATPKVLRLCQMTQAQLLDERKRLMQNVPTEATELEGHTKRLAVIANNLRIRFHDLSAPTLSTIVPPELPPAPTLDIDMTISNVSFPTGNSTDTIDSLLQALPTNLH